MFSFMIQKLLHKKWMVLCVLIGNILLIGIAISHPLYKASAFQNMLTEEFNNTLEDKEEWPAALHAKYGTLKGSSSLRFEKMRETLEENLGKLHLSMIQSVYSYQISTQKTKAGVVRDGQKEKRITLGAISDLGSHMELVFGDLPAGAITDDGVLEVMISDQAMIAQDILPGDEYTFENVKTNDGNICTIRVVGVFRMLEENSLYWQNMKSAQKDMVFVSMDTFKEQFLTDENELALSLDGVWDYYFDYEKMGSNQSYTLINRLNQLEKNEVLAGRIDYSLFKDVLSDYNQKSKRIEATLLILQMPVLLLLCAFLYMISGQMLTMEQNEISLMKSRGAKGVQILQLYFEQSLFLALISLVGGIPLGVIICKVLGTSTAFLEFSAKRALNIQFSQEAIWYAAAAILVSVVMTTVPVISYSKVSIVNLKQGKSHRKKTFWKKCYLDFICLAISLYGYYSFQRTSDNILEDVLTGKALDPLLYISFSLFILGAGLFCGRMQPIFLQLIYKMFGKRMKPAAYASILGTIRNGATQEFIILFMILTVSIGISNTTMARTIVANATYNTRHITGADLVIKEKWDSNQASVARDKSIKLSFTEPDFSRYEVMDGVENVTKVYRENGKIISGDSTLETTIMGIKTKEFASVTDMPQGLLPYAYYQYLNVLATNKQAVLVSENLMVSKGYKLGDSITLEGKNEGKAVAYIYGFFNYWPTYQPKVYSINDDGSLASTDQYMVVANLAYLQERFHVEPYEVWMDVEDEGEGFYEWLSANDSVKLTKLVNFSEEEESITRDTLFQGTNGILSMSFIVILILCCVGYLIYWIMSIRSRELLFGVLRAMGMKKNEITWLLVIEQICSGVYAIVMGGVVGILSSVMFVPLIQKAYAASTQVLPLQLIMKTGDMLQLFGMIFLMLCVCLAVLGKIVSKLNISSALKLGED